MASGGSRASATVQVSPTYIKKGEFEDTYETGTASIATEMHDIELNATFFCCGPKSKSSPPSTASKPIVPTKPLFPVNFSTTETSLRTHIFQGDIHSAAKLLTTSRIVGLGAGLTYPTELSFLVEPSDDRNKDPDVIAFKVSPSDELKENDV